MKLYPPFRVVAVAAAIAVLAVASSAQTVDGKPAVKAQILERVTDILENRAFVPGLDFARWKAFANAQKAKFDDSKDDDEFGAAVNEAFSKFGASHIALLTPRSTTYRDTGNTVGVGIATQRTEEGTLVIRTVPNAPAAKAGIVPGDLLVKVDGKPVEGTKGIAGAENTKVVLTVKRADGKTRDFTLTRSKFTTVRPEELEELRPDTAKLTVYTFDPVGYGAGNVETLMKRASKYKNLIVDLRDNGGGAVINVQHFLGLFMPRTSVGTFVDRSMTDAYAATVKEGEAFSLNKVAAWSRETPGWSSEQFKPFRNRNVPLYKGKVAVLVNGGSGSGAEIAAAAFHDLLGSEVIGTKSAGAVLAAYIVSATNGFSLEYPTSDYITVKGTRLEGVGVVPTVEVQDAKYRIFGAKDPVVDRALEVVAGPTNVAKLKSSVASYP